jgi:hypothetical protein
MSTEFRVKYLSEENYEKWDAFVASSPDGSIYNTAEYLDVFCGVTSASYRILAVLKNDEIFGGVALFERHSRLGDFVAPRLLLYYNGLVLRDFATSYPSKRTGRQIEIMSILEEQLSKMRYARLALNNRSTITDARVFKSRGWRIDLNFTYVVPLADMKRLWDRTEQNLRRLIKRCEKHDIRCTQDDDFDSFFQLHHEIHQRKGVSLYLPYKKFKTYFERLNSRGLCQLYHARMPDGKPLASQLVLLGKHPISHTVCAGAAAEYLKLGSNPFLRRKVFEDLSNRGYTGNDLTDATLNAVTHFKSQLGADLKVCFKFSKKDSVPFKLRERARITLARGKNRLAKRRYKKKRT